MDNVLKNLSEKTILHREQVLDIKRYIEKKYPDSTSSRRANIFANTVYQIVDESVSRFEEKHRIRIRSEVLKSAIAKDIFEISGYDVFEVCSNVKIDDEAEADLFFKRLTYWVNENQEEEVSLKQTREMVQMVLDQAISSMVDLLEDSFLIDDQIIEINRNSKELDGPEYIDNLPSVLDDHISDGRFMDVDGEIKNLTAQEIEKALQEDIPEVDGYGYSEKIAKGNDPKPDSNNPQDLAKQLGEQARGDQESGNERTEEDTVEEDINKDFKLDSDVEEDNNLDDQVFDSMDVLLMPEQSEEVQPAKPSKSSPASREGDLNWESIKQQEHKEESPPRLGGYELKPPPVIEEGSSKMSLKIRLLLIIPLVVVLLMVIIVLIVGAIQIGQKSSLNELESETASVARQEQASFYIDDMQVPGVLIDGQETFLLSNNRSRQKETDNEVAESYLHRDLQYREIDNQQLIRYLVNKNSSLATGNFVETLVEVASSYNVNPLLLVAITGQEQGFVPMDHQDAKSILNNPFNVYESWMDYNTDFEDSCKIAAATIVNLSKDRPDDTDPIEWINRKYAEDENWHLGVTYFLNDLNEWMADN